MPYVNIPETGLPGAIAVIVGKIQGNVSAKIVKQGLTITNKLNKKGCPTEPELIRMRNQKNQIDKAVKAMDGKLSKFASLPGKIKGPLSGLEAAYKIILALPIPQGIGIPPGPAGGLILGLPINITTKYADTMHLIKELIKQIKEIVISIEAVMKVPVGGTKVMKGNLSRADNALKACEVELALKKELEAGSISKDELEEAGLVDEDTGDLIFSSLGPKLLNQNSSKDLNGTSSDGLPNPNQKDASLQKGDLLDENTGRPINNIKSKDSDKAINDKLFTSGKADLSDSRFRGKWLPGVDYYEDDKVQSGTGDDKGIFVCQKGHTSTQETGFCSLGPDYKSEKECVEASIFSHNSKVNKQGTGVKIDTSGINDGDTAKGSAKGIWTKSGPPPVGPWNTPIEAENNAIKALDNGLTGLENSNLPSEVKDSLRGLLNDLTIPSIEERTDNSDFFYTGPNGDVYKLEIVKDPNSPSIAPRHYAIAKDYQDSIVLKGQKSFSSSVDVLLNEIKFRIDNQLP